MFKAIFFDLDQTLVDRTKTFTCYLEQVYSELVQPVSKVSAESFYEEVHRWDDNGYRDKHDTFSRVIDALKLPLTAETWLSHFKEHYGKDAELFEGAEGLLRELQRQYPLVLVSNGRHDGQMNKLHVTGIADVFTEILISESVGIKKPDPDIYMHGCRLLGVHPQDVLFVGDHPVNDVETPIQIGMQAIWVKNNNYSAPSHSNGTIHSVVELPEFL